MSATVPGPPPAPYPLQLTIDEPDQARNRLSVGLRVFWIIPIAIVLGAVSGSVWTSRPTEGSNVIVIAAAGGFLFWAPMLMILFRQKYPRWWFDWNVALLRFNNRVAAYALLLHDDYPSTDEEQYVHLELPYPDVKRHLNRWLPLVKWFLAIPHLIVLGFLWLAALIAVIVAWFAILFTGRCPKSVFRFVVDVIRWTDRVFAYAIILTTDAYPPFRFGP
jgi:hypothetical protein